MDAMSEAVLEENQDQLVECLWFVGKDERGPGDGRDDAAEVAADEAEVGGLLTAVRCELVGDADEQLGRQREEVGRRRRRACARPRSAPDSPPELEQLAPIGSTCFGAVETWSPSGRERAAQDDALEPDASDMIGERLGRARRRGRYESFRAAE